MRVPHILRRRKSRLQRWIDDQDQQCRVHTDTDDIEVFDVSEDDMQRIGTPCNPYLAYPHLGVPVGPKPFNEAGSMHSYVVVDDILDGPEVDANDHEDFDSEGAELMSLPASPALLPTPSTPSKSRIAPSSLRNFHLSFYSQRAPAISITPDSSISPDSSRLSFFRASPRASTNGMGHRHSKSSSLSTLNLSRPAVPPADPPTSQSRGSAGWKWRPSVLNHFSTPDAPQPQVQVQSNLLVPDPQQPSRPSMSSVVSYASSLATPPRTMTQDHNNPNNGMLLATPPPRTTIHLDSVRSRGKSRSPVRPPLFTNAPGTASVPSLWSGPTSRSASHVHTPPDASGSGSPPRPLAHKESAIRILFTPKRQHAPKAAATDDAEPETDDDEACPETKPPPGPHIVYPVGSRGAMSLSRLSMVSLTSSGGKRKKKLVVSGIDMADMQRTDALRVWCETFGEVTRIVRMPNADLHVQFRKAEVADTVCRVRARVTIPGVGSVQLSWCRGDKS